MTPEELRALQCRLTQEQFDDLKRLVVLYIDTETKDDDKRMPWETKNKKENLVFYLGNFLIYIKQNHLDVNRNP